MKPKAAAPMVSDIFEKEILNWPVRNMYDMTCKIKKAPIAVAAKVKAQLAAVLAVVGAMCAIVGFRKTAK
jgi:hypothetical protein